MSPGKPNAEVPGSLVDPNIHNINERMTVVIVRSLLVLLNATLSIGCDVAI